MHSFRLAILVLVAASALGAADWPQFRGPFFNGSTDEKDLPSKWSPTENIAWTADMPGPSAATPIVWQDHVFVSSTDAENRGLLALAFDRRTGKLRWKRDVPGKIAQDERSNFASSSPATDGDLVVFFYGNGELVAFDFPGKKLWGRNIQEDYGDFAFQWTFSSSPLLYDGRLYLQVLQRDVPVRGRGFRDRENKSYLLAMDPKTGKTLWRHYRPSKAVKESREAFTTPVPHEVNGRRILLVAGGDALTAHDPKNGDEIWRWGTWNPERIGHWRLVPSPVACGDIVLVCAPKGDPVYAIKAGGSGVLGEDAVAWVSNGREVSSDVPTPACYDGDFFVLSDKRKSISRVDPRTGKVEWSQQTPGFWKYEASPLVGDGRVYIINFKAEVVVLDADDGSILGEIPMGTAPGYPVRSSIAASRGQLFIRTNDKLYCVGEN